MAAGLPTLAQDSPHQEALDHLAVPPFVLGSQLIRKVYEIDPLRCPYCGATPNTTLNVSHK